MPPHVVCIAAAHLTKQPLPCESRHPSYSLHLTDGTLLSGRHGAQGVKGVLQKSFHTREEAEDFVRSHTTSRGRGIESVEKRARNSPIAAAASCASNQRGSPKGATSRETSRKSLKRSRVEDNHAPSRERGRGIDSLPPEHPHGELLVFTDGACAGNQNVAHFHNPAGWGVAIVRAPGISGSGGQGARSNGDHIGSIHGGGSSGGGSSGGGGGNSYDGSQMGADPRCELLADLYGPVVVDPQRFGYLYAEVGSNNTAELSAICEALLWLRDHAPTLPAAICYDSEYAAKVVQGIWQAHKNTKLVERGLELFREVRAQRTLRFVHIKSHRGHRWNERADSLAKRGAAGELCSIGRYQGC